MQKSKIKWSLLFMLLSSITTADNSETLSNAPKLFNLQQCIKESTKDCIAAACIEDAPADCPTQCKNIAESKCRAIARQKMLRIEED